MTRTTKRTWVIPAILVAGVTGLGGLAYAASAQDAGWRDGGGYSRDGGRDEYGSQRWRDDDRRNDDDRGPRWRRGDNDGCGPRGGGWGRGEYGWRHHGRGYDRDEGPREGRGYGWREGRRFDRDDSDRGYRGHGYHHRHEGRDRDGRGGPRFGQRFDPARLDGVKRELGVTAAQEQVWTKYAGTLKDVADARRARRDSIDRSAIAKMSPDDLRKFRDSMIDQRRKEQDQVRNAADDLVKSFDEKQVAIAKEVLPGYAFGPGMRMGMGMGGGRNR